MEYGRTTDGAIDPIKHQTMEMYVEIGGRSKTLYQRNGTGRSFSTLEACLLDQKCRDNAVDDL
jgi:hypothetical protein